MLPTGLGIVNIGVWYGLIRWSILAVLIILTFALIHSDNKKVREATPKDRVNRRKSYAAFIITLVASPFLILEINFTPENAPTEPVHHQEEKEEPEVVPDDIQPVTPDKKDEPTPSDSGSSDTPSVAPSKKSSTKPEEAPKGDEPTPTPEPTPEPKEVSYKVVHRQMDLDGTNYTTIDTAEGAGKTGDKVAPSVKSYTGFTSPSAQTITLIDGDNTITYNYARNKYTLTLGDNIETATPSGEYFYEATISIKAKTRQGYDFSRWLSNDETIDGKTDTTIEFAISDKAINIEADYAPRDDTPYTVIHYWQDVSGSGYTEHERENKTGTTDQEVTPAVIDYTSDGFVSPDTQTGKINGNGETVFKYNYNRKMVQLTLEDADQIETSTPSGEYRYGTEISLTAKAKTGYHFVKWSDDVTSATNTFTLASNKTVKPIYEANTYTVAFNKNNEAATGEMNSQNATYDTAFKLNANQFTLARHTFAGWSRTASATSAEFTDEANITENLAESGTVTLYAIWAESSYLVHFDAQGGTSVSDKEIAKGAKIGTLPSTTYEHHLFDGWFTQSGEQIDENTVINSETTFYAHWTKDITNADVDTSDVSIVREGTHDILVTPDSNMEPYTFSSNDDSIAAIDASGRITGIAAGTTEVYITGNRSHEIITINVTVTPKKVTVKFETDGGSAVDDMIIDENSKINPLPTTEKTGFTFLGWFTIDDEPLTVDDEIVIDTTFYAHWEEETHALVCRAAEELNAETCEQSGTNGCSGLTSSDVNGGLIEQGRITFGKIPDDQAPAAGNAYDCDVNGDGTYDPEQERFYYLADDGTNARLIYYSNYDVDKPDLTQSDHYDTSITRLPSKTHWTNSSLVEYDDGNISRFITAADYISACGINESDFTASGTLKNCIFMAERTQFVKPKTNNQYRAGIWFHKEQSANKYYRIQTSSKVVMPFNGPNDSDNSARPVIQVPLDLIEQPSASTYTISFDAQGGADVAPITKNRGEDITLPTTTKTGYILSGWSTTDSADNIIGKAGDIYRTGKSKTLYAIWEERDAVAYIDGFGDDGYQDSLQKAVNKAPTDGTKKYITLLKNTNEQITIAAGKNIEFELQGHTITYGDVVIKNSGTATLKNGTIYDTAVPTDEKKNAAINNDASTSVLYIQDCDVLTTSIRQAIYNKYGRLEISGNSNITADNDQRAAVHNLNNGTTIIKGGTITSTGLYAVYNEAGTLVIGEKDGVIDDNTPFISGNTYGVVAKNNATYSIYDGTIEGGTYSIGITNGSGTPPAATNDTTNSRISGIEDDSEITKTNDGKTLNLTPLVPKYLINLNANGGTVSPEKISVIQGERLGELPTPEYSHHDFLGWFTEAEGGSQVDEDTIPQASTTYFAHWNSTSQDDIVEFNIQKDAQNGYFAGIANWRDDKETLLDELKANFDNNDCKIAADKDMSNDFPEGWRYKETGSVICDQPKNYNTGVASGVNVFLSDENTKTKTGAPISYMDASDGILRNMIPGTTYYWESKDDSSVYGYVKATGNRRFIEIPDARNVRDLGGLVGKDGKKIKYGIMFRGEKMASDDSVAALKKLGVTTEYELRESDQNGSHFEDANRVNAATINYDIGTDMTSNYNKTRSALKQFMTDIIASKSIYFHCTHGADRTGTIAYLAETLLGVSKEDRYQDYELTTLSGRPDKTRYYDVKIQSGTPNRKFIWMTEDLDLKTYEDVVAWFLAGSGSAEQEAEDLTLIANFQLAALED